MKFFPLTTKFRATTYAKAFILNAIACAAVAALAIEMRIQLDDEKQPVYSYFSSLLGGGLSEMQKVGIVFSTAFIGAIIVYHLMYMFVGFGGGMLTTKTYRGPRLDL